MMPRGPMTDRGPDSDEPVDGVTIEGAEWWSLAATVLYMIGLIIDGLGMRVWNGQVMASGLLIMLAGGVAHLKSR